MPIEAAPAIAPDAPAPVDTTTSFEAAKAARREAPPPAETPAEKPAAVQIEMDAAQLKAATALSKENRAVRARAKELEAQVAGTAKLTEAQKLAAEGKHLAAIKAMGIDLNAAVQEELGTAPAAIEVDPVAAKLQAELDELKAAEAARAERDKTEAQRAAEAAQAADVAAVVEHVKVQAGKYVWLSKRPEWVQEAYAGAAAAYPALVEKKGSALDAGERHRLIIAALDEAEEEHATRAKMYGGAVTIDPRGRAKPQQASARPVTFDSSMRGGTAAPATKAKTKLTFDEAKRARRQG